MPITLSSHKPKGLAAIFRRACDKRGGWMCAVYTAAGLLTSQGARADLLNFSVDAVASVQGSLTGDIKQGAVIRTPESSKAASYRASASWLQNQGSGLEVWELTGSRHQQDLQVLGRLNIGPLKGFYMAREVAHLTMDDVSLAWRKGHRYKLTTASDLTISGGVSAHLLRASYVSADKSAGWALGLAPQMKLELDTQWNEASKTSLLFQLLHSPRLMDFQMQSHRIDFRYHHQLSGNSSWVWGVFHQHHRYDYKRPDRSTVMSMGAQGMSIALEKRI
jgi:hypothetical protein